jgi:hypothetical protein
MSASLQKLPNCCADASGSGHSLPFGSVSMSGLPPTTTEWRAFENKSKRAKSSREQMQQHESSILLGNLELGFVIYLLKAVCKPF